MHYPGSMLGQISQIRYDSTWMRCIASGHAYPTAAASAVLQFTFRMPPGTTVIDRVPPDRENREILKPPLTLIHQHLRIIGNLGSPCTRSLKIS